MTDERANPATTGAAGGADTADTTAVVRSPADDTTSYDDTAAAATAGESTAAEGEPVAPDAPIGANVDAGKGAERKHKHGSFARELPFLIVVALVLALTLKAFLV